MSKITNDGLTRSGKGA